MSILDRLTMRRWFAAITVFAVSLLAYALYLEHVRLLQPCPLCVLQRVAFVFMGVFALAGLVHNPAAGGWRWFYGGMIGLGGVFGMLVAGRHLWLQSLPPDQAPACGPGLSYMLETFPLSEVWQNLLHGSGSCAEVAWRFAGLSMPGWTLVWYVLLTAGTLFVILWQREP